MGPRERTPAGKRRPSAVRCLLTGIIAGAVLLPVQPAWAQEAGLTLTDARAQARRTSPLIAAARAAADAASGRERQSGAFPNPVLGYNREQTSPSTQDVAYIEQRLEVGGQRSARVAVARLRREAAEARLAQAEADLDAEVAQRFATAIAAQRRAELAAAAAEQFRGAVVITERRLAGGDVSGYEARRIRLEAARYAALAAEARLAERSAGLQLWSVVGEEPADPGRPLVALTPIASDLLDLSPDSTAALAIGGAAALRAITLDAEAARADLSLTRRERVPTPAITAGYLRQRSDGVGSQSGFVAGLAVPLPLWDRRSGAVDAADAEARRAAAELATARLRIGRAARAAAEAVRQTEAQVTALQGALGEDARAAIRAAEAAYAEGEITLIEWLDAVRAYHEAETAYGTVLAESFIQRAALERLLGVALIR